MGDVMKMHNFGKVTALLAAVGLWVGASTSANAAMVQFDLSSVVSGSAPSSQTTPWLTARFSDEAQGLQRGQVLLTMTAVNLDPGNAVLGGSPEYVGFWWFNMNPNRLQSQGGNGNQREWNLLVSSDNTAAIGGAVPRPTIAEDHDTVASFTFDFDFGFPSRNSAARFTQGESVSFVLSLASWTTGETSLSAADFNYLDTSGRLYTAAQVRAIDLPSGGEGSGHIGTPVPEPTTLIAGALLLLPFGVSTLRILRKKRAA